MKLCVEIISGIHKIILSIDEGNAFFRKKEMFSQKIIIKANLSFKWN